MKYRKLGQYKYQLLDPMTVIVDHYFPTIDIGWVTVNGGAITVKQGYCWDGASCAIDTADFMIPSLVHDALYQLIRLQHVETKHRLSADRILKDLCLLYGMSRFRANYVYFAVRMFGGKHLRLGEPQDKIYEIKER